MLPQGIRQVHSGNKSIFLLLWVEHGIYLFIYLDQLLEGTLLIMLNLLIIELLVVSNQAFEAFFEETYLPLLLNYINTSLHFGSQLMQLEAEEEHPHYLWVGHNVTAYEIAKLMVNGRENKMLEVNCVLILNLDWYLLLFLLFFRLLAHITTK